MIDSCSEVVEWTSVAARPAAATATPDRSVDHWRAMHRQGYFTDHRKYRDRRQTDGVTTLLGMLKPTPEDDLLEVGCGYGRVLFRLAPHVRRLVGVDVADEPLAEARRFLAESPNVELVRTSGLSLQEFAAATFDAVVSVTVFQHLPRLAVRRYFGEFGRILRPGGRVCVQFMTGGNTSGEIADEPTEQSVSWSAAQIADLAEGSGFRVERIEREVVDHPQFDWFWLRASQAR